MLRAADENKDQTYFLAGVARQHFAGVLFPLGALTKPQVRTLATEAGLPNHGRKDSTGICFIGERPFAEFLAEHVPPQPGAIETPEGEVLGQHPGLQFFTLGQRKGVRVGGVRGGIESPWYVVAKLAERNVLVVAQDAEHPLLMSSQVQTAPFHWLRHDIADGGELLARIRHRQPLQPCRIRREPNGTVLAAFSTPQRAVAAGQYLALYQGDECLGCGEIATSVTMATFF